MFDFFLAQCSHVAVPEATEVALRFYKSGNILWIVQQFCALAIPLLFLFRGFTGKLASIAKTCGRVWFFTIAVYLILFIFLYQLLNFPLAVYSDFIRMHDYNLSTQTFSRWFENYGKGTIVSLVASIAFIWIFYLLLKKSPRRWWFYSGLAASAISFLLMFVQPIWIDPLFNQFGPMKDKQLEEQILTLARRAGIEEGKVFEVDKSQDTTMLNAYVVGFGSTNRIVLWDTLLQQMTPDEILFVMGHEMGHYVLHHMWWGWVYFSALSLAIFYLTDRSARFLMKHNHKRFGFAHLDNIASLPLFLFLFTLFSLLTTPLSNYVSRIEEHEADRFGLEITQKNQAAAEGFIILQQKNLAIPYPGPVYKFWRCTHPPIGERIEFFNEYCPWKEGKPLKYGDRFKIPSEQG